LPHWPNYGRRLHRCQLPVGRFVIAITAWLSSPGHDRQGALIALALNNSSSFGSDLHAMVNTRGDLTAGGAARGALRPGITEASDQHESDWRPEVARERVICVLDRDRPASSLPARNRRAGAGGAPQSADNYITLR